MSISNRVFEAIERRGERLEVYYYIQRCLYNADLANREPEGTSQAENFLDQAHRLTDLMERLQK